MKLVHNGSNVNALTVRVASVKKKDNDLAISQNSVVNETRTENRKGTVGTVTVVRDQRTESNVSITETVRIEIVVIRSQRSTERNTRKTDLDHERKRCTESIERERMQWETNKLIVVCISFCY